MIGLDLSDAPDASQEQLLGLDLSEAKPAAQAPGPDLDLSDAPDAPQGQEPQAEGALNTLAQSYRGLAAGSAGLGQSAGAGVQWLGKRLGSETLAAGGESLADYYEGQVQAYGPGEDISRSVFQNPEQLGRASWWAYNLFNSIPSLAATVLPGMGTAKVLRLGGAAMEVTPQVMDRLARIGMAVGGGAAGGAMEGSSTYREVLRQGGSEEEAARAGEFMAAVSAGLNAVSLDTMFGKAGAGIGRRVVAGLTEGVTEAAEEPGEELSKDLAAYLETGTMPQGTWERMVAAARDRGLNVLGPSAILGFAGAGAGQESEGPAMIRPADLTGRDQAQGQEAIAAPVSESSDAALGPDKVSGPDQAQAAPAAADVLPYTRADAEQDLTRRFGDKDGKDLLGLFDALAESWAEREGHAPEQWYEKHLAGIVATDQEGVLAAGDLAQAAMRRSEAASMEDFLAEARAGDKVFRMEERTPDAVREALDAPEAVVNIPADFVRHLDNERPGEADALVAETPEILATADNVVVQQDMGNRGKRYAAVRTTGDQSTVVVFDRVQGTRGDRLLPVTIYTDNAKAVENFLESKGRKYAEGARGERSAEVGPQAANMVRAISSPDKASIDDSMPQGKARWSYGQEAQFGPGMEPEAVRQAVAPLQDTAANAAPLEVVADVAALPEHLQAQADQGQGRPEAVRDPETGKVFILADAVGSPEQAVALWLHEQGLHVGLRGLFGPDAAKLDAFLDQTFEHFGAESFADLAQAHGLDLATEDGRRRAAEERLAVLAEKVNLGEALDEREQGLWDRLVELVRAWLRERGVDVGISDADIARTVMDAVRWTVKGDGQELFQRGRDGQGAPSAATTRLDDMRGLVRLFRDAKADAVIHEAAHVIRPFLPAEDLAVVERWAGVKDGRWTVAAEEKFARAFERYCYEAKAPTARLRQVLSRMRRMLVQIYGNLKNLGVAPIPDDVRQVFDRMLSTEKEREAERATLAAIHSFGVDPEIVEASYDEPPAAPEDIQEWSDLMAEAERRALAGFDKERPQDLRRLRAAWRAEAQEVADNHPAHWVMDRVKSMGSEGLSQDYDHDTIMALNQKRRGLVRKGGLPYDMAMQAVGVEDSDAMIMQILEAPTKAQIIKDWMEQREAEYLRLKAQSEDFGQEYFAVQDAALEILGEMAGSPEPRGGQAEPSGRSGVIPSDFDEAERARLMGEAEARAERSGQDPLDHLERMTRRRVDQVRRQQARADVDEMLASDLGRTAQRLRAERVKLMNQAKAAFDSGDNLGALRAMNGLRDSDTLLREVERARLERETIARSVTASLARRIPEEYREQALAWAGRMGARNVGAAPRQTLLEFLHLKKLLPFVNRDAIAVLEKYPHTAWSVDQMRYAKDVLRQIVYFGATEGKLLAGKEALDFEQTMARVVSAIKAPPRPDVAIHPLPVNERRPGSFGQFLEGTNRAMAQMLKAEHVFRSLDNGQDMGPVWTACMKPVADARNEFLRLGQEASARLEAALAPVRERMTAWRKQKLSIKEIPRNIIQKRSVKNGQWTTEVQAGVPLLLSRESVFMAALNMGNLGNREALKAGYMWTEGDLAAISRKLTAEEWKMVQDVWDAIDGLYPHLNAVHKKLTGVTLRKVEAAPFQVQTADGQTLEIRGSYFPLQFDRGLSVRADQLGAVADIMEETRGVHFNPRPARGMTIERQGGRMAPLLSFEVISRHLLDTVHYASHALAIRDVDRIILDPRFRETVEAARGKDEYAQIRPWLQNVARPSREPRTVLELWMRRLRKNVQFAALAYRIPTAMIQLTSLTSTVNSLGFWPTARAAVSVLTSPSESWAFANDRSIALRNRRRSFDRDVVNNLGRFQAGWGNVSDTMLEWGMMPIGLVDSLAAHVTWLAAYKKAMDTNGWDEAKACEYADMTVRMSQGEGAAMSLSQVQSKPALELVTVFFSWFNTNYNNIVAAHRALKFDGGTRLDLARSAFWLLVAPVVMESLWKKGVPDDGDDWEELGKDVLTYGLAHFPLLRDIATPMITGYRPRFSPVQVAWEAPGNLVNALQAKEDRGRKVVKAAMQFAGAFTIFPTTAAVTAMNGALDLIQGKTDNPARLVFPAGRDEKKKKRMTYGGGK